MPIKPKWMTAFISILSVMSVSLKAKSENTADYVIVGLGTAGGLLAGKLTKDKKTSVIALHNGQNFTDSFILKYSQNMTFSVGLSFLGFPPTFDPNSFDLPPDIQQQFNNLVQVTNATVQKLYETGETVPQDDADDRILPWVIASPAGGASAVNAGAWVRITPEVLSQWEAIAGQQWSAASLLNVYKDLEDYHGKTTNKHARGHHGSIKITQDPHASTLSKKFTRAMIQATGIGFAEDYNDPNIPLCVSDQIQSAHRGDNGFYRVSSVNAFLGENVMTEGGKGRHDRKLKVHFNSMALRIIWDGQTAVGVQYLHNGQVKSVYAKKAVIVCAGLRSSAFLLYSGVGPAGLLGSLGIPVIFDNPNVGQGLIDQTPVPIVFATNPLDSQAGTTTVFSQIGNLPAPEGSPVGRQIRFATVDAIPGITPVIVDLLQPQSRGSITIASANPTDQPVVDFGLLSNPADLDLLTSTFQTYVKNLNLQLQAIDPQYQLLFPPPEILDDALLVQAYIEEIAGTDFHFQGHCRMAPLNQGGVVDSSGRVYGVNNLIVADNSIVPSPIDGSPMTSAYLIAANIARLLGY
jgi:choline dehydrogenase-like flavoprotein